MLDSKFARELARRMHLGQEYSEGIPYFNHVDGVANLVECNRGDMLETSYAETIAYLHDILEDTKMTEEILRQLFVDIIVDTVVVLTRDKENETYFEYLTKIKYSNNKYAIMVKKADIKFNMGHLYLIKNKQEYFRMSDKYKEAWDYLEQDDND